jgi:glycosyltransferase EpsF
MKPRATRVLQVIDSFGMGGAETWLMELLRFWSGTEAVQMDFVATGAKAGVFDDEALRLGAKIHYIRYGRRYLPAFVRQFRRVLLDGQYDAIHDHGDYVSGWHFLMGRDELPAVRVTHVHNPWLHIEANYGVSIARRLTTKAGGSLVRRLATHVCGTSAEILRRYGFSPDESRRPSVSVVHCGFDVARFNTGCVCDRQSVLREFGWPEEAQIVLFAGRLDRSLQFDHPQNHKNSWLALNVVRAAIDKQPRVRLLMAGSGDRRQQLERCVEAWGLTDEMRLVGVRKDVPRLMRAANILLFPSRQEGLGMVAVEAQATALPVLASTAVPRECVVVPELYNALALGEPVEVWAETLLHIMEKPRPSLEVCRSALLSSDFSIVNSARRLERIYSGN